MIRLGYYTGKIYREDTNVEDIKECCLCLNFKEPVYDNEELIVQKSNELRKRCVGCRGCEESRGGLRQ